MKRWVLKKVLAITGDRRFRGLPGTTYLARREALEGVRDELAYSLPPTWTTDCGQAYMFNALEDAVAQALVHDASLEEVEVLTDWWAHDPVWPGVVKVRDSLGRLWDYRKP